MSKYDSVVEGIIKKKMPGARIVSSRPSSVASEKGVINGPSADVVLAKWSNPSFIRSCGAVNVDTLSRVRPGEKVDLGVAVVEIDDGHSGGHKLRQTVVVDKKSGKIVGRSG